MNVFRLTKSRRRLRGLKSGYAMKRKVLLRRLYGPTTSDNNRSGT